MKPKRKPQHLTPAQQQIASLSLSDRFRLVAVMIEGGRKGLASVLALDCYHELVADVEAEA